LYDPLNPAVLNLIAGIIREANRANVPIAVCGEMAGDPALTKLLLAMGLTDFSMHFSQLLLVKREIMQADTRKLKMHIHELLAAYEPVEQGVLFNRLNSIH
jgi:phosphotransferase system enzyme I (PtsI)